MNLNKRARKGAVAVAVTVNLPFNSAVPARHRLHSILPDSDTHAIGEQDMAK